MIPQQILDKIKSLTRDEDLGQDLIIYYLEGNPPEKFKEYLASRQIEEKQYELMKDDELSYITDNCTEIETKILTLLMLGYSNEQMLEIEGISEIRLEQLLLNLKKNNYINNMINRWKMRYGTKN